MRESFLYSHKKQATFRRMESGLSSVLLKGIIFYRLCLRVLRLHLQLVESF